MKCAHPKGAPDRAVSGREHGPVEDGIRSQPGFVRRRRQRQAKVSALCEETGQAWKAKLRPQEKTLILFVIRDHVGSTPMSNLTNTLTQDMEKIWASLSKPPHLADATLASYFDLSFAALPHKVLMPEKFEEAVLELRKRFTDRSREDYVFQPAYHKRIPADGVGFYMEGIWVRFENV